MKKTITILLTLLMIAAISAPVFADTEGPVTGSFQTTVPPSINSIGVYTDASMTIVATSLTPLQTYYVKVSVTDNDKISDISLMKLKLFYTEGSSLPAQTGSFADVTSGTEQYTDLYTWDIDGGDTADASAGTWDISLPEPTTEEKATTSHDFKYTVKIGPVAKETGTSDKWQIAAEAIDSSNYTSYKAYTAGSSVYGLAMNWYGAITVPSTTVAWTNVKTGMGFEDAASAKEIFPSGSPIKYVSNGNWSGGVKVKTENQAWSTTGGKTVTLKTNHNNATNTFSLRASQMKSMPGSVVDETTQIPEGGTTADLLQSGTMSEEAGWSYTYNALYLSLSSSITYPGTYSGVIHYQIANR